MRGEDTQNQTLFSCVRTDDRNAYDTAALVAAALEFNVTPHVTQNINGHRGSNIDGRTMRHPGWIKGVAGTPRCKLKNGSRDRSSIHAHGQSKLTRSGRLAM